ncbi:MAG: hypothetical protein H7A51_09510 [Akkermansiaceae bacterium]|nr:hypothetical protein [Akkermansiaceae bacterium]
MKSENSRRLQPAKNGFALIATISVMVLLAMIALAMLSLAVIETRTTDGNKAMAQARANARMALMMALGQLQSATGADDRATAPSMAGSEQGIKEHWTGVYRVREEGEIKPVIARHETDYYITDKRSAGTDYVKDKLFVDWLVSQPDSGVDAVTEYAELVGAGSSTKSRAVEVPLVKSTKGAYAYWVSDESVKARIDHQLPAPLPNENSPGYLALLGTSPKSDLNALKDATGSLFPKYDRVASETWSRLLTYNENLLARLSADTRTGRDALRSSYFSLTNYSEGLLTNPLDGGFKKDLSAFIG